MKMIEWVKNHTRLLMILPIVFFAIVIGALSYLYITGAQELSEMKEAKHKSPLIREASISGGEFEVTWDMIPGASGYRVYLYDEVGETVVAKADAGNTDSYRGKAVTANAFVSVRSFFGKDAGRMSEKKEIYAESSAVEELLGKVEGDFNQISLTWTMADGREPGKKTRFRIYRKKTGKGEKQRKIAEAVAGSSYVDESTKCGATYRYEIEPYDTYKDKTIEGDRIPSKFIKLQKKQADIASVKQIDGGVYGTIKPVDGATCYRVYSRQDKVWNELIVVGEPKFFDSAAAGKTEYRAIPGREYIDGTAWGNKGGVTKSIFVKKKEKRQGLTAGSTEDLSALAIDGSSYSYEGDGTSSSFSSSVATSTPKQDSEGRHPLMGENGATVQQMVSYFESIGGNYPSVYAKKGAATITDFCQILYDTCAKYSIRDEYVFAQVCIETGNLSFAGSSVSADQCNFSGLGATGGGESGNSFSSVEEGLTAQIQHLRLYADPSYRAGADNVDKRYDESLAGNAPYVEWLEVGQNPNGGGWAVGEGYADQILSIADKITSQ